MIEEIKTPEGEDRKIYLTSFRGVVPCIKELTVISEAKEYYRVDPASARTVTGSYFYVPGRVAKKDYFIFDSEFKAYDYCLQDLRKTKASTEGKLALIQQELAKLDWVEERRGSEPVPPFAAAPLAGAREAALPASDTEGA